jgi:uncharacterized membrane protein
MTSTTLAAAIVLHLLAAVIWVGGMFFAHMALRPAAAELPTDLRLPFFSNVLERFFPWVWIAVLTILITGYGALFFFFGGISNARPYIHIMMGLGNLMSLLFAYLWFFPYRSLRAALEAKDLPTAARHQVRIRHVITINLALGLTTIVVAVAGRW